jgi:hypothetical protein
MHRVYIWTQRPLNIRLRAIPASSECEGRDKQPNFKADQTQAQDSTPAKSWLRCALNTAALNTAQRIGTDTQAYLQGLSTHRPLDMCRLSTRPLYTQASLHRPIDTQLNTAQHRQIECRLYTGIHTQIECRLYTGTHTALNPSMSTVYTYEIALKSALQPVHDSRWRVCHLEYHVLGEVSLSAQLPSRRPHFHSSFVSALRILHCLLWFEFGCFSYMCVSFVHVCVSSLPTCACL